MRKIAGIIFSAVIFFCMCDTAECSSFLEFPDTMWGMSVQEVLDARKITEADTAGCSIQGRGPHFYIENCDVFGQEASAIHFIFINLELGESKNLQEFDEDTMGGKERLCRVMIIYPAGTDMDVVWKELDKLYGDQSLSEITVFALYRAMGDGSLGEIVCTEAEDMKVFGSDTIGSLIDEEDMPFFRENWTIYQPNLDDEGWEYFLEEGRMVTAYSGNNEENPFIQFDAFVLAVYEELKEQREEPAGQSEK